MSTSAAFGTPPSRTPVVFDADTRDLRIGPYERHVDDPAEPTQVYSAYLSLLYAVRGAQPGERLALRSADLEALLLLVGDDPETIEQRLVGLMGCTPEEASILGGLLLRHRRVTATLGIAAGLALAGGGAAAWVDEPSRTAAPAAVVETTTAVDELLPIAGTTTSAPTTSAPTAPTAPTFVGPPTGSVTVAAPRPVAEAAAPQADPVDVAPVAVAPAPVVVPVAAPVAAPVEAPVAAPVAPPAAEPEPAGYVLPLYEDPVLDAPPPVEEQPESDIGTPAILVPDVPLPEIGGVVDSGELKDPAPVEPEAPLPLQAPVDVVAEEPSTAEGLSAPTS